MFDFAAITSAGASLKTAADLAKAFMDVKVAVDVQGKVFDMQRAILAAQQDLFSAQQAQAGLVDENRKLLERIKALEAWDVERQRYRLADVGNGAMAYERTAGEAANEPQHRLCAACVQQGRKAFLQSQTRVPGMTEYLVCNECGGELLVCGVWQPEHTGGTRRR